MSDVKLNPEELRAFGDGRDLRAVLNLLRVPFPKEQIGKIPASQGRPALDYVGHAAVTDRLNSVVPEWSWRELERFVVGNTWWIHGEITIAGVRREEYGDGANPKAAVGNFLRRAAMRFGVAIDLWSREELEDVRAAGSAGSGPRPAERSPTGRGPSSSAVEQQEAGEKPGLGEGPAAASGEAGGVAGGGASSAKPHHVHEIVPVPRAELAAKGWRTCKECGATWGPGEEPND